MFAFTSDYNCKCWVSFFCPIVTCDHSHRGWWQRRAPNLSASWTCAETTTRSRRQPNSTASWSWRSSRRWSSSRRSRTATSQRRPVLASMSSRKHLLLTREGATSSWTIFFFLLFIIKSGVWENILTECHIFPPGKNDPNPKISPFSIHLWLICMTFTLTRVH